MLRPEFFMQINSAIKSTVDLLRPHSDSAELDAQVLLAHILDKSRPWIIAHPETPLTALEADSLRDALSKLTMGTPLPYSLGHWEFFARDFIVTPDVLIPRPETELLVERALAWLKESPQRRLAADVGTGSGCIAISLAASLTDLQVLATDISPAALEVAKRNALQHNVADQINFLECDLLPPSSTFDLRPSTLNPSSFTFHLSSLNLLCANLPYIPTKTMRGLPIYGREPTLALDGGHDGLALIRRLLSLAPQWLAPRALILLETESSLGPQTVALAREYFPQAEINLHKDLAGHERLVEIQT